MPNDYLQHHGIKGMKWGIRRTEAQLARVRGKAKKENWSEDARSVGEIRTKSEKQMSNAEIRKVNERMDLERRYSQLNPGVIKKGSMKVAAATGIMATALAFYNNADRAVKTGQTVATKVVDIAGDMLIKDLNKRL